MIWSKEFNDHRTFEQIYDLECSQVWNKISIEAILEYYIDTGFYHPRVCDVARDGFCIETRFNKYRLKPEHLEHAREFRKRNGIMQK